MKVKLTGIAALVALGTTACTKPPEPPPGPPPPSPVQRGEYLVAYGGCHDCHTPKVWTDHGPTLDAKRLLSGHPANEPVAAVPEGVISPDGWIALGNGHFTAWAGPWGVSYAANLTPDATGLGSWTEQDLIKAMRTGKHAGVGRPILPPMPWEGIAKLTDDDLKAMFAYLRSVPPIANQVPAPIPPAGAPPADAMSPDAAPAAAPPPG